WTCSAYGPRSVGIVSKPTLRGPYAEQVHQAIEFLANKALTPDEKLPGFIGYIHGDEGSRMHGHGYATLALATACGNLGPRRADAIRAEIDAGLPPRDLPFSDKVRWALEKAVRLTESAQDPDQGGWMYDPYPNGHEGSMTVTQ